jgi:hypothetical protein
LLLTAATTTERSTSPGERAASKPNFEFIARIREIEVGT